MTRPVFGHEKTRLDLAPHGQVEYWPLAAPHSEIVDAEQELSGRLEWRQLPVRMFGRSIPQPRLTAFYGNREVNYRYSGLTLQARPWTGELEKLRRIAEELSGRKYNSVLCNLYRDGRDYMGWHADDERELGSNPVIASMSFGAERRFLLKPRNGEEERIEFLLKSGSLLVMRGDLQRHWLHQLPRALRISRKRINLTFRQIGAAA
ncbi:MAG TPA: alpha-ketoglutarate-dependent dioxygenase AlkB [Wenzhouxiangella sp.]|nr:alpha-ketoglutarate-dependent dioxygenase AlkB [Wenzhouxiangella sp.]